MNRKLFTVTLLVLCIMSSGAMQATQPVSADQKAREVAAQSRAPESAQKTDHATAYPAAAAASAPVSATADLKNAVENLQPCLDAINSVNIIGLKKLLDENNYCLEALERLESHNKAEMKKKLAINARDSQFPTMVSISKELQTRMTQAHNAAAQLIDNHLKELNIELQFYRAIFPSNEHDEKKRQKVMQNETIKSLLEATQPTALMRAAFLGDAKQVAELLKTATEQTINAQHIGKSALMFATMMGHAPIAKMLLAHKASVHLKDTDGNTALHHATTSYHMANTTLELHSSEARQEIIDALITAGATANDVNHKGRTPLMLACMDILQVGTIAALNRHNPNTALKDASQKTAMAYAKAIAQSAKAQELCRRFVNNQTADAQAANAAILKAKEYGDKMIRELNGNLGAGTALAALPAASATHSDFGHIPASTKEETERAVEMATQGTELMRAAGGNDFAAVKKILAQPGLNVHIIDAQWRTALHHAALVGAQPALIEALVFAGCSIEAQDRDGITPIMLACLESRTNGNKNKLETVRAILVAYNKFKQKDNAEPEIPDYGEALDAQDLHNAFTALHYVIVHKEPALTRLLIDSGAKFTLISKAGLTALEFAQQQYELALSIGASQEDMSALNEILIILKKTVQQALPIDPAAPEVIKITRTGTTEQLRAALSNRNTKKAINKFDRHGKTALMYAAIEDDTEKQGVLLDAGADVNLKDKMGVSKWILPGHTALHWATLQNHPKTVQFLHSRGADLNAATESGATALMLSVPKRTPHIFDYLLTHNADTKAETRSGDTAYTLASARFKESSQDSVRKHVYEKLRSLRKEQRALLATQKDAEEKHALELERKRAEKKRRDADQRERMKQLARTAGFRSISGASSPTDSAAAGSGCDRETPTDALNIVSPNFSTNVGPLPAECANEFYTLTHCTPTAELTDASRETPFSPTGGTGAGLSPSPLTTNSPVNFGSAASPDSGGSSGSPQTIELSLVPMIAAGGAGAAPMPPAQVPQTTPLKLTIQGSGTQHVAILDPNEPTRLTIKIPKKKKSLTGTAMIKHAAEATNSKIKTEKPENLLEEARRRNYQKWAVISPKDLAANLAFYKQEYADYNQIWHELCMRRQHGIKFDHALMARCFQERKRAYTMQHVIQDEITAQASK